MTFCCAGSIQLVVEVSECDAKPIFVCLDEWHEYARDHQWSKQKDDVCDCALFHDDLYDS